MATIADLHNTHEKVQKLFNKLGRNRPDVLIVANEYRKKFHAVGNIFADENEDLSIAMVSNLPPSTELGIGSRQALVDLFKWLLPKLNTLVS